MKVSRSLRGIAILAGVIILGFAVANLPGRRIAGASIPVVRADAGCSLASLNGSYAVARQGTVVTSIPALGVVAPAPFAEVAIAHFNGAGTFFGSASVNIGGVALNVPFTGTYTVNSDCTGNNTVNTNLGITLQQALVVINGGQRFIETETDALAVVEGRVEKLGD